MEQRERSGWGGCAVGGTGHGHVQLPLTIATSLALGIRCGPAFGLDTTSPTTAWSPLSANVCQGGVGIGGNHVQPVGASGSSVCAGTVNCCTAVEVAGRQPTAWLGACQTMLAGPLRLTSR